MKYIKFRSCVLIFFLFVLNITTINAEDGYDLWLRYKLIPKNDLRLQYQQVCKRINFYGHSKTIDVSTKELSNGLTGLLGINIEIKTNASLANGDIIMGIPAQSNIIKALGLTKKLNAIGKEGFLIISQKVKNKNCTVITANSDIGVLYGVFHFLKLLQTQRPINNLKISDYPKTQKRILNHWDNLNGSIERGYAGKSIWDWKSLPQKIDKRYIDYARANASIGINGTVLNNVNANPLILDDDYLLKVKALADVFRPYGIKVYLSAAFNSPMVLGKLKTADPLNPQVKEWWATKVKAIYQLIPDFGGFCIKANSEGQPGPQDYGRSHVDGANMLADVFAPYGGIVMWRAFVYKNKASEDRVKEAYEEFKPFDGAFKENVLLQVKNGPIDFQPREPFSPLFGAMPKTPLMLEVQITQEYLGFATHLVYLGSLFKEALESDTYAKGKGSTVSEIVEGKLDNHQLTGMAGVANIGDAKNWTGHPFAQSNWFAFGCLSWNPDMDNEEIVKQWLRMTFSNDQDFIEPISEMMLHSRETAVNYMSPLGLTMLMDHSHYRPAPWRRDKPLPIGTAHSFHHADAVGLGYNRTASGSNAVAQYFPEVTRKYSDVKTCPEKYLLWFHHVGWNHQMQSGKSLWDELCTKYQNGVNSVDAMQTTWNGIKNKVDAERFNTVKDLLSEQKDEANIWKNACLLYFQTFSKQSFPKNIVPPTHDLTYYKSLKN